MEKREEAMNSRRHEDFLDEKKNKAYLEKSYFFQIRNMHGHFPDQYYWFVLFDSSCAYAFYAEQYMG